VRAYDYARSFRATCGHLVGWPGVARLGLHERKTLWYWCETCDKKVRLPVEVEDWEDAIDKPRPLPKKPRKKAVKKDPREPRRKDGLW
jgi:hypothetical protein